ncbi:MAG: NAD(P)/FAD-dependent oxidoreductase [Magnetococcales bacterium]|nr:NAD(P)/FAD-dependent oxidoreductase [Magnetococcales bacterium]
MQESLIVVGNGMAALRTLEELTELAPDRYRITVYGTEPHAGYNRILLSSVLAGEKQLDQIITHPVTWYNERGIELKAGVSVTAIDRKTQRITDSLGNRVPYDKLLLATGSHPVILPLPGHTLPGVLPFRDAIDVERMLAAAQGGGQHAVVIGGGLLGLEAAMGLLKQGMEVTVVHLMGSLMERQLDADAAELLRCELEMRGLRFRLNAESAAILGEQQVTGLRLKSGEILPADLLVMAVGIRPNADLARSAGLVCNRGIVVDDHLSSSDPAIVAVGECVEHRGVVYGLVAPLYAQGKVLARHLAGVESPGCYEGSTVSTRLKVTGVDLCSAGEIHGEKEDEILIFTDPARRVYKKLIVHNERVRGMVLLGDTRDGPWYLELMQRQEPITPIREHILFGNAHLGDAGHGPAGVVHLSDDHEVCGCNGVKKGRILEAISRLGLTSVEEVRTHTKASGSCGSCTGVVEQLLAAALGGDYVSPVAKALCGCTQRTSDEVREAVREGQAMPVRAVMARLGWSTPDGCPACRQAIQYYLTVFHPASHQEERSARFVNERYHANIQKDGTYSVVPRIFGGITAAKELKMLADLVERFAIPEVKFTGGQRLTLLGIRREQLPAIWSELSSHGMVSGHAYGKAVRTVKTCVGSRWCRFGTQDSEALGVELEQKLWNCWTPHKVKLAVSGCPRNCAEATIKDIGVVGVESGWEIHVGGNGGIKVRVTDLLTKVATHEEVQEWSAAFLQLYRREARYLERTATWLDRVGIGFVREQLADPAMRLALASEFQKAHTEIEDPWQAGSKTESARHFAPLAIIGQQTEVAA